MLTKKQKTLPAGLKAKILKSKKKKKKDFQVELDQRGQRVHQIK